jgi:hypothetical protein
MSDKDLLVVISEMLRKQDQHSEILSNQTKILNIHTKKFEEMDSTLKSLLDISITQFEKQQVFNEKMLDRFNKQEDFNNKLLDKFDQQQEFNNRILGKFDQQQEFNAKLVDKLDNLGKA